MHLWRLRACLVVAVLFAAASATRSADPAAGAAEQKVLDKWLGS